MVAKIILSFAAIGAIAAIALRENRPLGAAVICIDQFGYPAMARKVAFIRRPQLGYDSERATQVGSEFAVIRAETGTIAASGKATPWRAGTTDESSGDKVSLFDFSAVTTPGRYFIRDLNGDVKSFQFSIGNDVYRAALGHAVRTFFYQRAGFEKKQEYAGERWADGASHIAPGQDRNARLYSAPSDPRTERDLSGGWYDAGDYNRYTNWASRNVIALLKAYRDNPSAFGDNSMIPESGNGRPDILDEAKWGLDWLIRMQNPDGSVLSVLGVAHASPPSAATGPSFYGLASASATLSASAAYAFASKTFEDIGERDFASGLRLAAIRAYDWADRNPNVIFRNNDASSGSEGLASGQQEVDDYGRLQKKLEAATYLFELTGDARYREYFDANYARAHLIEWTYASPFEAEMQDALLYYASTPKATADVSERIRSSFRHAMSSVQGMADSDPYNAYIERYTWGSNRTKALQGLMYLEADAYGAASASIRDPSDAALAYLNYIHGANPLGIVYLTNMGVAGAAFSVKKVWHSWFGAATSPGPPPGFLVGGPNPSYKPDGCCPNKCGLKGNAVCISQNLTPPMKQPPQKAFRDFDAGWPLNSWTVTENSNDYQAAYIRLLSQFVK